MDIKEIESTFIVLKWVYPIISFCFLMIVSLLIYIWKTNTARTDVILEKTNETLASLLILTAVHEAKIEALTK